RFYTVITHTSTFYTLSIPLTPLFTKLSNTASHTSPKANIRLILHLSSSPLSCPILVYSKPHEHENFPIRTLSLVFISTPDITKSLYCLSALFKQGHGPLPNGPLSSFISKNESIS